MQNFLKSNKWVILLFGALIQIFTGIPAAWGVFQTSVCKDYNLTPHAGSMVFSFIICAYGLGCILGGFVQDKKGPRFAGVLGTILLSFGFILCGFLPKEHPALLYMLFSVPCGLGTSLLYPAVMSCAQKWYSTKKGFATGVIGAGVGFSGAVLTILGTWLINTYSIRQAFIILGFIMLIVCGISCVFLENPKAEHSKNNYKINSTNQNNKENTNYTLLQILKTPQYYLLLSAVCFACPSMILFSPIIVQIAQNKGLSINFALSCIAIGSVFSAAGRLSMPWLSDKIGRKKVYLLLFSLLFIISFAFIFANSVWVIVIYCLLAFCYSAQAAVLPATVTDLYGQQNTGMHYGFVALGMSIGSIIFPLIANAFNGEETTRHVIAIISTFLGLVCILFIKPTHGNRL